MVITYQDLIAFRIPSTFLSSAQFEEYRATSRLTVPAAQRVIAYSESVRREIASEFGIPLAEIPVVPLGVEAGWFSGRGPRDRLIRSLLACRSLLLQRRQRLSPQELADHARCLRPVPSTMDERRAPLARPRWLHLRGPQRPLSAARVGASRSRRRFPRPRLPASAKGFVSRRACPGILFAVRRIRIAPAGSDGREAPVIAMPISALPEVGGDCVLYPDGLSAAALARAMEHLAASEPLRDELRKAPKWVEHFRWEKTALATCDVYRSTVLRPSERSLQIRRLLRDALLGWASKELPWANADPSDLSSAQMPPSLGVRMPGNRSRSRWARG